MRTKPRLPLPPLFRPKPGQKVSRRAQARCHAGWVRRPRGWGLGWRFVLEPVEYIQDLVEPGFGLGGLEKRLEFVGLKVSLEQGLDVDRLPPAVHDAEARRVLGWLEAVFERNLAAEPRTVDVDKVGVQGSWARRLGVLSGLAFARWNAHGMVFSAVGGGAAPPLPYLLFSMAGFGKFAKTSSAFLRTSSGRS
jgi:hypothetical protein